MKNIVLLSGGIDSATALALAVSQYGYGNVMAVCADYGQQHSREINAAAAVASYYSVPLNFINYRLTGIYSQSSCSLLSNNTETISKGSYAEQLKDKPGGMVDTYVPFRNGLLISSAAAMLMSIYPKDHGLIWAGMHADDAAGNAYPDCSLDFCENMNLALLYGTSGAIVLNTPFVDKTKSQIVAIGLELGVPYELTWSCYCGGTEPCGECGTCQDRKEAFAKNGAVDPAYKFPGIPLNPS